MKSDEVAMLARRVARKVRVLIPRSANRQLEEEGKATTWLAGDIPEHINLLHTLVRTSSTVGDTPPTRGASVGGALGTLVRRRQTKLMGFTIKTKHDPVKVGELKKAILSFMDSHRIDLRYRTPEEERQFCADFGDKLADYLNNRGFRKRKDTGPEEWKGSDVVYRLYMDLLEHQRLFKYGFDREGNNPGDATQAIDLPMKYVVGNARNALKFRVGNCEEVASTAYVMLTLGKSATEPLNTGGAEIPVELVYLRTSGGDAHYFVLLNRPLDYINETKDEWVEDPDTIACDPWITDEGLGGRITEKSAAMAELRSWIKGSTICIRAASELARGSEHIKQSDEAKFYL